jgi:hypothetical protein
MLPEVARAGNEQVEMFVSCSVLLFHLIYPIIQSNADAATQNEECKYNFSAKLKSEIARKVLETQVDGEGSFVYFLRSRYT